MVALASSVHAGPSQFALLLGSGISVGAGVPSGWDVMVDLLRRLAVLHDEDVCDDPLAWYRERSGGEPDYSRVIEELAPFRGDRRNLLSSYFEPTQQEQDDGLKVPTKAHRAIAGLVADSFVKVIVTTNFDRLLEDALTEVGVAASVVSSPDSARGAQPIVHSRCTIIKVHGDYLSPDIKNTVAELASYDPAIDKMLDEVFDQYGLIVCGWSGIWDEALRNAVLRAPSRRFAAYWLHRGQTSPQADYIIGNRKAIRINIQDADSAMEDLAGKVKALSEAMDQRPEDTAVVVAQLKRYLPNPVHRIRLHDLMTGEIDAAIEQFRDLPADVEVTPEIYAEHMRMYEQAMARVMQLLANGAFFSDRERHDRTWVRCIERLAARTQTQTSDSRLVAMQQYPTLLAFYVLALGALAADRIDPIARVLAEINIRENYYNSSPIYVSTASFRVLDDNMIRQSIDELKNHRTPVSDYLWSTVRPAASAVFGDPARCEDLFDEVEYLMGIAYVVSREGRCISGRWSPYRASWRSDFSGRSGYCPGDLVKRNAKILISTGLFDSQEQQQQICELYDEWLSTVYM